MAEMSVNFANETDDIIANLTTTLEDAILLSTDVNGMWLLTCAIFFFITQMGSAFYKAGSVPCTMVLSSGAGTIAEVVIPALMWYLVGHGIAFHQGVVVGTETDNYAKNSVSEGYPMLFFSLIVVTSIFTPICGVLVGRISFVPYCIIVALFSGLVFPVAAHWVWGTEGYLAVWSSEKVGGGVLASSSPLMLFLLPASYAICLSRYIGLGSFTSIPKIGHNRFFETVGLFFIWMAQFGLHTSRIGYSPVNHQEPLSPNSLSATLMFTTICSSFAALSTIIASREMLGYFSLESIISCSISGLVMSSGVGFYVPLAYAPLMGLLATFCYYVSVYVFEARLGIHDPLDGVVNCFLPSLVSTLLTPLFADLSLLKLPSVEGFATEVPSREELFASHVLAIVCVLFWAVLSAGATILILHKLSSVMQVINKATDIDRAEHGMSHCDYTDWLVAPLVASKEAFEEFKKRSVLSKLRELRTGTYEIDQEEMDADTASLTSELAQVKSASQLIRIPVDTAARFAATLISGVNMTTMFQSQNDIVGVGKEGCSTASLVSDPAFKNQVSFFSIMTSKSSFEFSSLSRPGGMFLLRLFVYVAILSSVTAVTATVDGNTDVESPVETITKDLAMEEIEQLVSSLQSELESLTASINATWALTCGIIVFSMQLGFCFLEAGSVRSGNVINIIFKNLGDCAIGSLMWWCIGYSIAYGEGSKVAGGEDSLFALHPSADNPNASKYSHFFLSFTYMTTAVTIVSGAVAERISLTAYYSFVVLSTGFIYPIVVHCIWSEYGWLSPFSDARYAANGVLDFAGSVVIHCYGGCSAIVFACILGNRVLPDGIDLFSEEGQLMVAPHNRFQQATGTLLLWFAWFGFNAGSVGGMSGGGSDIAALAAVNTILSSASSAIVGLALTQYMFGHFDIGHVCNSALTGMVGITAGCAYMSPPYAIIVGVISTPVYFSIHKLRYNLRIDDVVDAGAVHFGGGAWGGIAAGLFCDSTRIKLATGNSELGEYYGLFLGSDHHQLVVQCIGVLSVFCWAIVTTTVIGFTLKRTVGIRVPEIDELRGLDMSEHNAFSYDYVEKLEAERIRATSSISMVQNVSELLLKFDLESAQAFIDRSAAEGSQQADQLSSMRSSLETIVGNLKLFRPFLPDAIFSCIDGDQGDEGNGNPSLPAAATTGTFTSHSHSQSQTSGYEKLLDIQRAIGLGVRKRRVVACECYCPIRNVEDAYKITSKLVSTCESLLSSREGSVSVGQMGIVQTISRGSIVITWQGHRAHRLAARFADDLLEDRSISAGLSAGIAQTGNVGTQTLKSNFCYGDPLERANIFSRLAGVIKCRILCCRSLAHKFETYATVRPVDRIQGPAFDANGSDVYSFEGIPGMRTADWMYDQVKDDPYPLYKAAWRFLLSGSYERAMDDISKHLVTQPDDRQAQLVQMYAKNRCIPMRMSRSLPFSGGCENRVDTPAAAVAAAVVAISSGLRVNIFMFKKTSFKSPTTPKSRAP